MMKKGIQNYRDEKPFEERAVEADSILKKFPDNVPIIGKI